MLPMIKQCTGFRIKRKLGRYKFPVFICNALDVCLFLYNGAPKRNYVYG